MKFVAVLVHSLAIAWAVDAANDLTGEPLSILPRALVAVVVSAAGTLSPWGPQ